MNVKRRLWGLYARVYPVVTTSIPYQEMMREVSELIAPGATVVDIGCGTGGLLPYLKDIHSYTGIDAEPEMLEVAGKTAAEVWKSGEGPHVKFLKGSVFDDLEWPDADTYVLCNVFYTLDDKVGALKILFERMPKGAQLIICDPNGMPDIRAVMSEHFHAYREAYGAWAQFKHRVVITPKLVAIVLLNGMIFQEFQFVSAAGQIGMSQTVGLSLCLEGWTYSGQNSLILVQKP